MNDYNTIISVARKIARDNGLVLREEKFYINGNKSFSFNDRKTKEVVSQHWTYHALKCEIENGGLEKFIVECL